MFHLSLRTALRGLLGAFSLLAVTVPALAHEGGGIVGDFSAGLLHPLVGPDHILAMVAVGIWGAFLGAPAIWVLPVVFPLVMPAGAKPAGRAWAYRTDWISTPVSVLPSFFAAITPAALPSI